MLSICLLINLQSFLNRGKLSVLFLAKIRWLLWHLLAIGASRDQQARLLLYLKKLSQSEKVDLRVSYCISPWHPGTLQRSFMILVMGSALYELIVLLFSHRIPTFEFFLLGPLLTRFFKCRLVRIHCSPFFTAYSHI